MTNTNIEAPWHAFRKKVNALLGADHDIDIGEIYTPEDGTSDYAFDIEVRNHKKYSALDAVFPKVRKFGNVTLRINIYDEENAEKSEKSVELYTTVFDGNPVVNDIKKIQDVFGSHHGFIRFKPQVIQFFHDDGSDYDGNWSGLAQDIAKEVFPNAPAGIHFCSAPVNEP